MNKFTPGPWKILPEEAGKDYIRIRGTALGRRYKIANVLTPTYEVVHTRETEETRANANLIAAAPEMLDMLKKMQIWGELYSQDHKIEFVELARLLNQLEKKQ